jgi:hypothetical protein
VLSHVPFAAAEGRGAPKIDGMAKWPGRVPGHLFVCRACLTALGCKSPSHPDGGEVIAKRKGVVVRRGLKEAWSKDASRWTRTGYEAYGAGRAGKGPRSPYPSRALVVNSAVAR